MFVSQACQATLGMTKRVRDGSITLDDYDAQSLEVARQMETVLFMIRIDHLIYNDFVCSLLLNDLVTDLDDDLVDNSLARDSDQSTSSDCFTHAMVNVPFVNFRGVCFGLIRLSCRCGLLNGFPGRPQRRHKFWGSHEELETRGRQVVDSSEDNYPGVCNGRSIWMIVRRKFDDRDSEQF